MIRRLTGALVILVTSAMLAACPGTSNVPAKNLLTLINEKRAAAGCAAVVGNDKLRVAAERHAVDIRDHPAHFGPPGTKTPPNDIHKGTDGSNGGKRIVDAGYNPKLWGEIIYTSGGPPSNNEQATIDWWMNSPDHKANIENCGFKEAGVGLLYPGGVQWIAVVVFGTHQ
jgi:uncharacterized protein YkwD